MPRKYAPLGIFSITLINEAHRCVCVYVHGYSLMSNAVHISNQNSATFLEGEWWYNYYKGAFFMLLLLYKHY